MFGTPLIIALSVISCSEAFLIDNVYFQATRLTVYNNYADIELYEVTVPPFANILQWNFYIDLYDRSCPPSRIQFQYQHGGYPLVQENADTFPPNYRLNRTNARNLTLTDVGKVYSIQEMSPLAGRWFAGAYLNQFDNSEAVSKLGSRSCVFTIQMNITIMSLDVIEDIVADQTLYKLLEEEKQTYSFSIEDSVWGYTAAVMGCTDDEGATITNCSLLMSVKDGGVPGTNITGTQHITCSSFSPDAPCTQTIVSPRIDQQQYIRLTRSKDSKPFNVDFKITTHAFGRIEPHPIISTTTTTAPTTTTATTTTTTTTTTKEPTATAITTKEPKTTTKQPTTTNHQSKQSSSSTTVKSQTTTPSNNTTAIKKSKNPEPEVNTADEDLNEHQIRRKRSLAFNFLQSSIPKLDRIENPGSSFRTIFTASPEFGGSDFNIVEGQEDLVAFEMMPTKDQGGTLVFTATLNSTVVDTNAEIVTVTGCLSPNRVPVNGSSLLCGQDFHFSLNATKSASDAPANTTTMLFPYPEPGTWYLVMKVTCWEPNGKDSTPVPSKCKLPYYSVLFELFTTPCDQGQCTDIGQCKQFYTSSILFSVCNCQANYHGYGCTDPSKALSQAVQLTDTLLLVLSNLLFIPSIATATARRYYTEALVYFANMIFSTFYHACDMGPWSRYRLCVMPYHVLSYCDFFTSVLSIWVTLLAVAELPPALSSFCHMTGALALAMAVEWKEHGLWHNVVPIALGVIIVAISWMVRCRRLHRCYPNRRGWLCLLPGVILAGIGLVLFAFVETDSNYPYTHSTWHCCMALCIVFLLPRKKKEPPCTIICEESDSSIELDFNSESVNLVPANNIL